MLRTLVLAAALTSTAGSSLAPALSTTLAPVDLVAEGFGSLRGIVVDADDRVHVADRQAGTVTRIDPDGRRAVVSGLARPVGLALDLQGGVLVAEERAGRVVRLDPGAPTPLARDIKQPRWLAVRPEGTVYVSARRLTRDADPEPDDESLEPEAILAISPDGALSVFADGFDHLQGLAADAHAVYAATTGKRGVPRQGGVVYRIPVLPDGRAGRPVRLGPRDVFERPVGLALDRVGALYATAPATILDGPPSRHVVVKLQPGGAASAFATGLDDPRGVALDSRGNLYVADGHGGRILRFVAPAGPALGGLPGFTKQAAVTLAGVTDPYARVDAFVNDGDIPFTMAATAAGEFVLTITAAANTPNRVEVLATAARGRGLTGAPSHIGFVHDSIAPSVVVQAPPASAFVRGTVEVRADAADGGAGLATLGVAVAGHALAATVAPPLPAPASSALATWSTAGVADGAHTLTAHAVDRAGNAGTVSHVVTVDGTPPETDIVAGPTGTIATSSATLAFTGSDNLTPATSLQFAWRLDGGPPSPFAADTSLTLNDLGPGPHVVEVMARDMAGNEDPTPARREFSVSAADIAVTIVSPAAGAQLSGDEVIVRGTVTASGDDVGVNVNGFAALVHHAEWAVQIPLVPGDNLVRAVARAGSGAEATASVLVSGTGPAPGVFLRAEPSSGVAPLQVTWRIASRTPRALVRFELDEQGTGAFGAPVAVLDGMQTLYPIPGLRFPTVRATDDQGDVHVATTVVHVDDAHAAAARFQALWAGFIARLQAGDEPGALARLAPALRSRLAPVFQQLGAALGTIAAGLGPVELIDQVDDLAEAALLQAEDGVTRLYFIYFRRDNRGQWLIQEM